MRPCTLQLDLYEPEADTVTERPAIIFMHGGGFSTGSKRSPELVDQANHFAERGYVTASISYRLAENGCSSAGPDAECLTAIAHALEDAQTAVRHVRDEAGAYGIDTDRIAFAGTSAGAITAANVALRSAEDPDAGVAGAVSLSGASILTTPNEGDAPLLLFHGTADPLVPYQWAVNTRDRAEGTGARVVLHHWDGAGHVPYVEFREQILNGTRNFLYHHLDLADAAR
ncbi:MAG: alpha/beta hydrolase [Acidimicrobiales bacterium]|nr:alpha/beta hydrolase [Acidimicrobiales bacterium]